MIKLYLDWNIMSGLKNGHFPELSAIVLNEQKFFLPYSTSHIGDILASIKNHSEEEQRLINQDLDFIREISKNQCLFNTGEQVLINTIDPGELLDDRIREAPLFTDFSLDSLFSSIGNDPLINSMKDMLATIQLDSAFKAAFDNPESADMMNKMFPGLKEEPNMNGFFKSLGNMYQNLNEKEDYKFLRDSVQKIGVNSGHFNDDKDPYEVIQNAYKKLGIEPFNPDQYFDKNKNAPAWFNDLTNSYITLDMHGYKADKVRVNEKESNTFKNTTEDASHTAFASLCDIFITNDNKNFFKTQKVYDKFGVRTKVFKPQEFISYYHKYLNQKTFDDSYAAVINDLNNIENRQPLYLDNGDFFGVEKFCDYFHFNFFNKIIIPKTNNEDFYFLLSKETPSNYFICTQHEINQLLQLFIEKLGMDCDGKSILEGNEIQSLDFWEGRTWITNIGKIRLCIENTRFHLYFYLNNN
ncbi:MAG TPA: hypothetical protein VK164_02565 [Flavobacterium sp.]|uniref:hypothetical protein n=1 Tax=Flavobacterium sp. TaxID=239 RepID=UPI002B4ACBBD|nr:hypothetical protein [Flavobacterium sp.]HLO72796.1 hypothetical protein [Flavobacterium sp.]